MCVNFYEQFAHGLRTFSLYVKTFHTCLGALWGVYCPLKHIVGPLVM